MCNKHNMTFTVAHTTFYTFHKPLSLKRSASMCSLRHLSLYIMFRTGNVVRYLMLYAPAPSSWPMPDRLASKSWASPDSITSSVRGNFRAHAMATITGSDGVGSRLNPHFNLFSQIVVSLSGGRNMTGKQCYHRISPALYGGNLCKRHYNDKG